MTLTFNNWWEKDTFLSVSNKKSQWAAKKKALKTSARAENTSYSVIQWVSTKDCPIV